MNPLEKDVYNISAHRLNLFKECPFKLCAYLSHWDKTPIDTTYINAGKAVHGYMEDLIAGHPQDTQYYLDKFEVNKTMFDRVSICIRNAQKYSSCKGETELTQHTVFVTPKGRKVDLETRIDFKADDGNVYDWKTGSKLDSEEYIRQMHTYIFASSFKSSATLVSLLTGDSLTLSESPPTYIPALCDEYIDAIEGLDFERNTKNPFCSKCEYFDMYCKGNKKFIEIKNNTVCAKGDEKDDQNV